MTSKFWRQENTGLEFLTNCHSMFCWCVGVGMCGERHITIPDKQGFIPKTKSILWSRTNAINIYVLKFTKSL
jgi:hypothetical protein